MQLGNTRPASVTATIDIQIGELGEVIPDPQILVTGVVVDELDATPIPCHVIRCEWVQ
jgi:hypothetical protein